MRFMLVSIQHSESSSECECRSEGKTLSAGVKRPIREEKRTNTEMSVIFLMSKHVLEGSGERLKIQAVVCVWSFIIK